MPYSQYRRKFRRGVKGRDLDKHGTKVNWRQKSIARQMPAKHYEENVQANWNVYDSPHAYMSVLSGPTVGTNAGNRLGYRILVTGLTVGVRIGTLFKDGNSVSNAITTTATFPVRLTLAAKQFEEPAATTEVNLGNEMYKSAHASSTDQLSEVMILMDYKKMHHRFVEDTDADPRNQGVLYIRRYIPLNTVVSWSGSSPNLVFKLFLSTDHANGADKSPPGSANTYHLGVDWQVDWHFRDILS